MLSEAQMQVLANHIRANTDPAVVAALAIRNDDAIRDWYNTPTASDAWHAACPRQELFDLMNITQFDGITQGKREVWLLLLNEAERTNGLDMRRAKFRSAVLDVWNAATANAILFGCVVKLLRVGQIFPTSSATSGNVTALVADYNSPLQSYEVSVALNVF